MKTIIFGGPTISEKEVRSIYANAQYMPPAKYTDIISAIHNYKPDVVGIIDGFIYDYLAVWHKEILYAIDNGIRIYGSAGMGALRAVELNQFGMIGIGSVFNLYKNGQIEDDDEVFVRFKKKNGNYIRLSEPMVNLRETFRNALEQNIIDESTYTLLHEAAKSLHYNDRSFETIYKEAGKMGLNSWVIEKCNSYTKEHYIDLMKQDAQKMIKEIAALESAENHIEKGTTSYSMIFAPLFERDRMVAWDDIEFPLYYISNYLCLYHPNAETLNYNGLNREMSLYLASILQIEVEEKDINKEVERFRTKHDLNTEEVLNKWLDDNDLLKRDFKALMKKQAIIRKMQYWFFTSRRQLIKNTSYLLEELKLENKYVEWKKKVGMREKEIQAMESFFTEEFTKTDFIDCYKSYLKNHKLPWNVPINEASKEMGMKKNDIKIEMMREQLYNKKMIALALELINT